MTNNERECPVDHNLIFDLTGDAIILIDSRQKILFFNKGAELIFGYDQAEILGKSLLKLLPERYQKSHQDHVDNFQISSENSKFMAERSEVYGLRKDGSEFPAEVSISKVESDDKNNFVAVLRDITDRKRHDKKIESALREKEVLLQEVHHRVKNNLQIISSLLNLQSDQLDTEKEINAIGEAQIRVRSIALIHERLYRSGDFSEINFGEYLDDLIENLLTFLGGKCQVDFDIARSDASIGLDQAVPVALLMNELIVNCLKHAFPNADNGKIKIAYYIDNNSFVLEVCDNGVGLPENFNILESDTLGMLLITNLTSQLEGQINFLNKKKGMVCEFLFLI